VTRNFNDSLNRIIEKSEEIINLKAKGHSVDKSVLGRFGDLLVCQNLGLLTKHPDLLLAASKIESSEKMILRIENGESKK